MRQAHFFAMGNACSDLRHVSLQCSHVQTGDDRAWRFRLPYVGLLKVS